MQNPKYVINLIDLQNIQTSATGESAVQQLEDIVQFATKTVAADFLSNFTPGVGVNVLSDMNVGSLTVAGTLTASSFISGNSNIFVSGDLGESTVYNTLYNPPVVSISQIYSNAPVVAGSNDGAIFTVPQSGIYQLQTLLRVGGSVPVINTAGYINTFLFDVSGSSNVPSAQQTISGSGLIGPDPSSSVIEYTYQNIFNLTASTSYRYTVLTRNGAGGAGTWNLGSSSALNTQLFRLS